MHHPSTSPSARSARPAAESRPLRAAAPDVRDRLFEPIAGRSFALEVTATEPAVLAGAHRLTALAVQLGLELEWTARDGDRLQPGAPVARGRGDAWKIVRAEETLLSAIGKASGVASAAAQLVGMAGDRARIVCGAWKKVAPELRAELREAVALGGGGQRILDRPFVYLDKNYVRMLGGVAAAVRQARRIEDRAIVVQLRGEAQAIGREADAAIDAGADVLMVDTGRLPDLADVSERARRREPGRIVVAFGGGVHPGNVAAVIEAGAQVLDVGRAILDAPLVDFRLDVG